MKKRYGLPGRKWLGTWAKVNDYLLWLVIFAFMLQPVAFADGLAGGTFMAPQKRDAGADASLEGVAKGSDPCHRIINGKMDPKDPCVQAKLFDEAAMWEMITAGVYGAAAATCITECIQTEITGGASQGLNVACFLVGLGAAATDLSATVLMKTTAKQDLKDQFNEAQLAGLGIASVVAFASAANINTATGLAINVSDAQQALNKAGDAADKVEKAKELEKAKNAKEGKNDTDRMACVIGVVYVLMASQRGYAYTRAKSVAEDAREKKKRVISDGPTIALTGDAPQTGIKSQIQAPGPGQVDPRSATTPNTAPKEKSLDEKAEALAAQARDVNPPMTNAFENLTKRPLSDVFRNMLTQDQPNGFTAAAAVAADQLGPEGLNFAKQTADFVETIPKDEKDKILGMDKAGHKAEFATASSSGGSAKKSNPLGGIGDMFSNLFGKKPGAQETSATNKANFGKQPARAPASEQGFHNPGVSIFDVITKRYRTDYAAFDAGAILVPAQASVPSTSGAGSTPASAPPANPYLKH